jgi:spermidine/putrescine transport system permease protein
MGWFALFLLAPMGFVLAYSFLKRGTYGDLVPDPGPENYLRAADFLYLRVVWSSLKLALLTVVSCLAAGFPVAYTIATAGKRWKAPLLVLIVVPFWTSFVVRTHALKVFLGESGPLNALLLAAGWAGEPVQFNNSFFAVWLGMLCNYLPFMVLPLYVSMEKFDFSLLDAARDLGASHSRAIREVLLPLVRPGLVAGSVLVFAPALGEFVIPDLLGGAKVMLLGNVIADQFLKTRDWPFGSALSVLLVVIVAAALGLHQRALERRP